MKRQFELEGVNGAPVATDDLVEDLVRVATTHGNRLTQRNYDKEGKFSSSTAVRRFGSWANALSVANGRPGNVIGYHDEQLFANLLTLWQHYGRQPRRSELARPPSSISQQPYNRRFRSWSGALKAFVEYANESENCLPVENPQSSRPPSSRDPSLRLRFRILQADRFSCRLCGASPATAYQTRLHVDHIIPWSIGGSTTFDNLQTLCQNCNLGKSNVF